MHETDRKVKLEESSSMYILKLPLDFTEQSGAVEACWAHNPEVRGSKPRSANIFFSLKNSRKRFFYVCIFKEMQNSYIKVPKCCANDLEKSPWFVYWSSQLFLKFKNIRDLIILIRNPLKRMHRPGIEPGSPAWQASILPLDHRCLYHPGQVYILMVKCLQLEWKHNETNLLLFGVFKDILVNRNESIVCSSMLVSSVV